MKLKYPYSQAAAAAVSLLIAGCGGGGGDSGSTASDDTPALQVSGTAATGKALAGGAVNVKCSVGTGTATTAANGTYSVTIAGGALPCLVEVTGTVGGVDVKLHAAVESGTADGNRTRAIADVTPITEMIMAQLQAALPSTVFADATQVQVDATALATAVRNVLDALRAAGIDLGTTDPLKADLVASTGAQAGDDYDRMLDALGAKVPPASLPLVVNQIALSAAAGSSSGLQQATAAVNGGALAGCASAVSGSYRTMDYDGLTAVHAVDFRAGTFDNGTITPSTTEACRFTASTANAGGGTTTYDVVVGPQGAGAYTVVDSTNTAAAKAGHFFPAQATPRAALAGNWTYIENAAPQLGSPNFLGDWTLAASGDMTPCTYQAQDFTTCVASPAPYTVTARSDGGYDVSAQGFSNIVVFYAYRAPNGAMAMFGTGDPAGSGGSLGIILGAQLQSLPLPAVGSSTSYWDVQMQNVGGLGATTAVAPTAQSTTIQSVDSNAQTATRVRQSDGRVDTVTYNQPLAGFRTRQAGTTYAATYMMGVPGMGVNVSVDTTDTAPHFYVISVNRP